MVTRRDFLLVNVSAGIAALLPSVLRRGLTTQEQQTLLAVARTIFPHDNVPDRVYLRAIARVDARCRADPTIANALARGLTALEWACPNSFARMSASARISVLRVIRSGRFFNVAYAELLEALYGPPEMWMLFVPTGAA